VSRVGAQLNEGATHKTEMDSADDLGLLVGGLEQGAAVQLDDPNAGIGGRREPELVEQGATLDASGLAPGVHRFECLIHPWMRTTVVVR